MANHIHKSIFCLSLSLLIIAMTSCNATIQPTDAPATPEMQTVIPSLEQDISSVSKSPDDSLPPYVIYLRDNSIPLSKLSEYDLINERFSSYRIILAGETHGVKKNFDAELMLLKYLYETQNARHLLLEVGYCTGELLNQYITGGNEEILKIVMENLEGTSSYSKEYYYFFKDIFEYNSGLDDNSKLQLFGVDVEHQFYTGIYLIKTLFPSNTTAPAEISAEIRALLKPSYSQKNFVKLEASIEEHEAIYKDYLGDAVFKRFIRAIKGIRQGIEYKSSNADNYREKCLKKIRSKS